MPSFFKAIEPLDISTPFVDPPATPKEVVISVAAGKPTVIAPELSATSTSLEVPAKLIVPPKDMVEAFAPTPKIIDELANLEFAIEPANIEFSTDVAAMVAVSVPLAKLVSVTLPVRSPPNVMTGDLFIVTADAISPPSILSDTAVPVPLKIASIVSKLAFNFCPQLVETSSSGLVNDKFVVVVSAITLKPAYLILSMFLLKPFVLSKLE